MNDGDNDKELARKEIQRLTLEAAELARSALDGLDKARAAMDAAKDVAFSSGLNFYAVAHWSLTTGMLAALEHEASEVLDWDASNSEKWNSSGCSF